MFSPLPTEDNITLAELAKARKPEHRCSEVELHSQSREMATGNWKDPDLDFWPLENLSDINLSWLDHQELADMNGNGNLANLGAGAQGVSGSPDVGGGSGKVSPKSRSLELSALTRDNCSELQHCFWSARKQWPMKRSEWHRGAMAEARNQHNGCFKHSAASAALRQQTGTSR
jgi:hypothetical protein